MRSPVLFSPHKQPWLWDVLLQEAFPIADFFSSLLSALSQQSRHGQAARWEEKITKCGESWEYCQSSRMSFLLVCIKNIRSEQGWFVFLCKTLLTFFCLSPSSSGALQWWIVGKVLGHITNFWLITLEPEFPRDVSWQLVQFLSELCLNYLFVHPISLLNRALKHWLQQILVLFFLDYIRFQFKMIGSWVKKLTETTEYTSVCRCCTVCATNTTFMHISHERMDGLWPIALKYASECVFTTVVWWFTYLCGVSLFSVNKSLKCLYIR